MAQLTFQCPSCKRKLKAVESSNVATQIVRRTCACREIWQLKVEPVSILSKARIDKAEFTFLGRKEGTKQTSRARVLAGEWGNSVPFWIRVNDPKEAGRHARKAAHWAIRYLATQ